MAVITGSRPIANGAVASYTLFVGPLFPEASYLGATVSCVMTGDTVTFMPFMIVRDIVFEFNYLGWFHCVTGNNEKK